jgi:hypothetical protein
MTRSFAYRCALVAAAGSIACSRGDAPKIPLGLATSADSARAVAAAHAILGPAAKAALDSANVLYRRKSYADALVQYRAASALAPQHAAPFFGIYMVARATHNAAMADSALADIRLRNGPLPSPTHTLNDSVLGRMHELVRTKPTT